MVSPAQFSLIYKKKFRFAIRAINLSQNEVDVLFKIFARLLLLIPSCTLAEFWVKWRNVLVSKVLSKMDTFRRLCTEKHVREKDSQDDKIK
jgi:hypothetical protein